MKKPKFIKEIKKEIKKDRDKRIEEAILEDVDIIESFEQLEKLHTFLRHKKQKQQTPIPTADTVLLSNLHSQRMLSKNTAKLVLVTFLLVIVQVLEFVSSLTGKDIIRNWLVSLIYVVILLGLLTLLADVINAMLIRFHIVMKYFWKKDKASILFILIVLGGMLLRYFGVHF